MFPANGPSGLTWRRACLSNDIGPHGILCTHVAFPSSVVVPSSCRARASKIVRPCGWGSGFRFSPPRHARDSAS
eukprot:15192060-Alexandrium_andersonii.AAC.1